MKTKVIVLALAGLGMTAALMANGPRGGWDDPHGGPEMHQGDRQHGMHRRGGPRGFARRMARQLDLTKDQRQKIRAIFRAERQSKKAERRAHRPHGKQGHHHSGLFGSLNPATFMSADSFDKEAFKKAVQEQAQQRKAAREARRKARLDHRADLMEKVFNILTPEQRVKWIELGRKNVQ